MLNTPSSFPSTLPPRRRGAPPSNRNALRHGLYAVRNPTPFTGLTVSLGSSRGLLAQYRDVYRQAIQIFRQKTLLAFQMSEKSKDFRSLLSWHRLLSKMMDAFARLQMAWFRLEQPLRNLHFVSQHAFDFIRYDFRSQGITRDADLFRGKRELSDFNSPPFHGSQETSRAVPFHPFLSSAQWAILEPLLPPADHGGSRGRPSADPRELLDAVFWKIANHARWQDLPAGYPPMLTCRRYYRRLFLSGRLATLYSALYEDLRTRGQVDLTALVDQGCFMLTDNTVTLSPGLEEIWQLRTALLFLQYAYQVFWRFQPRTKYARHRK